MCSTTTAEASESQAKLREQSTEILQSNHIHSVLLRELIGRQEELISIQKEQAQALENIQSSPASTVGSTSPPPATCPATSSAPSFAPSFAGPCPSDYRDNSDNASVMSQRSTLSLRLRRPDYLADLKASRAYKRLRYFGLGIDSSSDSVLSFDSACSNGNWSMLSDMTLGDLSVSQIAVLNLPIYLADVSNPEPFQAQFPMEQPPNPRGKRSSRGRIHNAIENGNIFVVRTLLTIGMDLEELDSKGRTPLVHAVVKQQVAICKLLLERGANVEEWKAFTCGMTFTEMLRLLIPSAKSMCMHHMTSDSTRNESTL